MKRVLENVLTNGLVSPVFQPIFHIESLKIIGYEALTRGPCGPLQTPWALFKYAEKYGYMMELEKICIEQIIKYTSSLPPGLKLFINLSPLAIENGCLDYLNRDYIVEITEVGVINDYGKIKKIIDFYRRQKGIKVAVDDVGNGYDRLRSIAELEPDYIKIDRGLIKGCHKNIGRRRVLKHLVALAAEIQAKVVAEGIEDVDELNVAGVIGINYAQGFYLGKPQSKPWKKQSMQVAIQPLLK